MSAPPSPGRAERLARLTSQRWDVVVIGGGITGAGIARDAALRGLATALVEADDWASGTSSRSSRLVHGGVRYLEHGHLHLVFESSRERRVARDPRAGDAAADDDDVPAPARQACQPLGAAGARGCAHAATAARAAA